MGCRAAEYDEQLTADERAPDSRDQARQRTLGK